MAWTRPDQKDPEMKELLRLWFEGGDKRLTVAERLHDGDRMKFVEFLSHLLYVTGVGEIHDAMRALGKLIARVPERRQGGNKIAIDLAKSYLEGQDDLTVDRDARLSHASDGIHVQAWLRVSQQDIDLMKRRKGQQS